MITIYSGIRKQITPQVTHASFPSTPLYDTKPDWGRIGPTLLSSMYL